MSSVANWRTVLAQRDNLLAQSLEGQPSAVGGALHGVVFSKDRPLQLDGLLSSYFGLVSNPAPLTVLCRASDGAYARAYAEVEEAHRAEAVTFVREECFRANLLTVLDRLTEPRIFFLVDDDLFIRSFDMKAFDAIDPAQAIVSFRLGQGLDYCYTSAEKQSIPPLASEGDFMRWTWREGELDWGYPISVDGHIFSTAEIRSMTRASAFVAPNTYEIALAAFTNRFSEREGICFPTPRMTNIPANKVQTENANRASDVAPEWLLEQWTLGRRLDWRRLIDIRTSSVHEDLSLPLTDASLVVG